MALLAVVDYGAGNLMSVCQALRFLHCPHEIVREAEAIEKADGIILPGVGAFADAMQALDKNGLTDVLRNVAFQKPFLGICLGMQLLFEESEEMGHTSGLGLLPGQVVPIQTDLKLPQMGWNELEILRPNPLTASLKNGDWAYFVHSFAVQPDRPEDIAVVCDYHTSVPAMVARDNLFGCQFHPEKSGETGLSILKNFAQLVGEVSA